MKTMMNVQRKRTDIKRTSGSVGKRLFIILFSLGLAFGASAQRGYVGHGYVGGGFHGGYYAPAPRVYYAPGYYGGWGWGLGFGLGWGIPGWYGPWGPWMSPYGYPPYYYGRGPMPPALEDQISGIKSDYKAQIKDVKHDKALSHSDKQAKINDLEKQRDAAITQARHDFFYSQMRNYNGQPQNNSQPQNNNAKPAPGNGNSGNDPDHPEYSDK
jgi:hypothetical protein